MGHTLTVAERANRLNARANILAVANLGRPVALKRFTSKHIKQAVNKCRRLNLVDGFTLETAGYQAKKKVNP